MAISGRLNQFLKDARVRYTIAKHAVAYTAQEIAAAQHVPGRQLAKSVLVLAKSDPVLAVLPAIHRVDLAKLKRLLKSSKLSIAREADIKNRFPDVEVGAMSPFGNLYGVPVIVDDSLSSTGKIVFNAGSHAETITMEYGDFARLVRPKVPTFAQPFATPAKTKRTAAKKSVSKKPTKKKLLQIADSLKLPDNYIDLVPIIETRLKSIAPHRGVTIPDSSSIRHFQAIAKRPLPEEIFRAVGPTSEPGFSRFQGFMRLVVLQAKWDGISPQQVIDEALGRQRGSTKDAEIELCPNEAAKWLKGIVKNFRARKGVLEYLRENHPECIHPVFGVERTEALIAEHFHDANCDILQMTDAQLLSRLEQIPKRALTNDAEDDSAYVPEKQLWNGPFNTYKKFKTWLDKNKNNIRTRKNGQRLLIHAGDFHKVLGRRESDKFESLDSEIQDGLLADEFARK